MNYNCAYARAQRRKHNLATKCLQEHLIKVCSKSKMSDNICWKLLNIKNHNLHTWLKAFELQHVTGPKLWSFWSLSEGMLLIVDSPKYARNWRSSQWRKWISLMTSTITKMEELAQQGLATCRLPRRDPQWDTDLARDHFLGRPEPQHSIGKHWIKIKFKIDMHLK